MDEYMFITLAKLKADRLKLEREQRASQPLETFGEQPVDTHRRTARTTWFASEPHWKEQS